jgi:hypothetical protein
MKALEGKQHFLFIKFGQKKKLVLNRDRDFFLKPDSGLQFGFATLPQGPVKCRFLLDKEREILYLFFMCPYCQVLIRNWSIIFGSDKYCTVFYEDLVILGNFIFDVILYFDIVLYFRY